DKESSLNRLIQEIYSNLQQNAYDSNYIIDRAILATKNEHADTINDIVINSFPGNPTYYYSYDSVLNDMHNLYQLEFLNSITPNGLPPHKLTLKEGSPVICIRNLDPMNGICNGTRLICRTFHRNVIEAEIATGNHQGKRIFLPRIPLMPSQDTKLPFAFKRKQFPIRPAFALTINKSQGQTIPHVGIYLPEPVFSHGQLYVALSRGVLDITTKVLVKNGNIHGKKGVYTRNMVYKEALK